MMELNTAMAEKKRYEKSEEPEEIDETDTDSNMQREQKESKKKKKLVITTRELLPDRAPRIASQPESKKIVLIQVSLKYGSG